MFKSLEDIDNKLNKHLEYRKKCLNLIASENYASDKVRSYLSGDFSNRYGCYTTLNPDDREYSGNKYINEFELETHKLVLDMFGGKYVDLRPISGHMAGMSVVLSMLNPSDTVVEVSLKDWGHGLVGPMRQISHFASTINVEYMPFKNGEVDLEGLIKLCEKVKPKVVIFGGSGTIFYEPIKEFKYTADKLNIIVAYDASHITGLIAGNIISNPIENGADIMFGSTHKSFPGPQGGFVVSNKEQHIEKIGKALSPSLVTSHHLNRLPALAASILEMKKYGKEYASQIVKNSKALASELYSLGFDVIGNKDKYFTETHLILIDISKYIDKVPSKLLEKAYILCSDDFSGDSVQIRVGTPEITRKGAKESDMITIAKFFKDILIDKKDIKKVSKEVENFMSKFQELHYNF